MSIWEHKLVARKGISFKLEFYIINSSIVVYNVSSSLLVDGNGKFGRLLQNFLKNDSGVTFPGSHYI